jgi:hypothetical protein
MALPRKGWNHLAVLARSFGTKIQEGLTLKDRTGRYLAVGNRGEYVNFPSVLHLSVVKTSAFAFHRHGAK